MASKTYEVRRRNSKTLTDVCVARKASKEAAERSIARMESFNGRQTDVSRYIKVA